MKALLLETNLNIRDFGTAAIITYRYARHNFDCKSASDDRDIMNDDYW